jgi:hypothetical protein
MYQSKRYDDSPASSQRITQHNTHFEGCNLLEAGLQRRGPEIVLLAPEVGHQLAIVNFAHQIQGLLKIPNSIGMYIPTDNPPKSSIFMKFTKDGPPTSRNEPSVGHPHTT